MVTAKLPDIRLSTIGEETRGVDFNTSFTKRVSRGVLFCEAGKERDEYTISYISLAIFLFGLIVDFYLLVKYANLNNTDISFFNTITITIFFSITGLLLHVILVNRNLKIEKFTALLFFSMMIGLGTGGATLALQAVIKMIKFDVLAPDYYLFFISVAIAEEMFWRFGIQASFKILFNFVIYRNKKEGNYVVKEENRGLSKWLSSGISVLITAFLFMIFHTFVYSDVTDLTIVFFMGIIFGGSFELTKRIDTSMLAHIAVNLVAGLALINLYFGGF